MNEWWMYALIMLFSVFISSCSQVVLKNAAEKTYKRKIDEYLNARVIVSYGVFFISSFITVYALKYVPLSFAPVIESSGYVFVALLGYFILKEKMNRQKVIGIIIIIAGVVVFSL